jgi:hypothetical protein
VKDCQVLCLFDKTAYTFLLEVVHLQLTWTLAMEVVKEGYDKMTSLGVRKGWQKYLRWKDTGTSLCHYK